MLNRQIPVGLRRIIRTSLKGRIFIGLLLVAGCLVLFVEYFIWTCVLLVTSKTFSVPMTSQSQRINSDVIHLGNTGDRENNTTAKATIHGRTQQVKVGKLTVHVWFDLCGKNVDTLRRWPLFPFFPDTRSSISNFQTIQMNGSSNGQRIFGFIEPRTTCRYKFALSTALGCSSELWLSQNEDSTSSRLIVDLFDETTGANNKRQQTITSRRTITLQAGRKYFIELLTIHGNTDSYVSVAWSCVDVLKPAFELISSRYISSSYVDTERIPSHASKRTDRSKRLSSRHVQLDHFRLPFVTKEEYNSIPVCSYSPSFLINKKLARYEGALKVLALKTSKVFPQDDTDMKNRSRKWTEPNLVAYWRLIHSVVNRLVYSMKSGKYFLKRIHKVIQKSDPPHGDRFSVDLELGLIDTNQSYRLSEHVYQKTTDSSLCLPEGINWNKSATVYFILPVKNQGKWVHYFIDQVSEANLLTGDTNFHVMVVDFDSQDIDLGKAFNTSLLKSRHTVINKKGKFYKTLALNEAASLVPSPHDILFLFDLHIDVPADILDSVRKNTIEGHIAYLPVVGRLDCDSDSVEHRGFWQMNGYGLTAVYKSDWIRFGGMNTRDYKYKWGGEDWDLLDRVLSAQLEVERIKYPGLFHHHHSKQRSWN